MNANTKTILAVENIPEAVAFAQFASEMTPEQRREMLIFMQGVKFARSTVIEAPPDRAGA